LAVTPVVSVGRPPASDPFFTERGVNIVPAGEMMHGRAVSNQARNSETLGQWSGATQASEPAQTSRETQNEVERFEKAGTQIATAPSADARFGYDQSTTVHSVNSVFRSASVSSTNQPLAAKSETGKEGVEAQFSNLAYMSEKAISESYSTKGNTVLIEPVLDKTVIGDRSTGESKLDQPDDSAAFDLVEHAYGMRPEMAVQNPALVRAALDRLGIVRSSTEQTIFQLASREYRSFNKWRRRDQSPLAMYY